MLKIALAGAANTGKLELAAALTRALQACGEHAFEVVVADTPERLTGLAPNNLTLLMGLKIRQASACSAGTLEAEDGLIRTELANAGVPYQVIYGEGEERLAQALQAAQRLLLPRSWMLLPGGQAGKPKTSPWVWMCDKCSDPQCEHRLLSALLAHRSKA
jgi:hypothetical protein